MGNDSINETNEMNHRLHKINTEERKDGRAQKGNNQKLCSLLIFNDFSASSVVKF